MNEPRRIFIGVDARQPVAYNVLQWSLQWGAKRPIIVQPILLRQLPQGIPRGLTDFSLSRYLVPWLCGFKGRALFMDADMVATHDTDINELFDLMENEFFDVAMNTELPRFEWPSMMLFDCPAFEHITPETLSSIKNPLADRTIESFPSQWNRMVITGGDGKDADHAKILHFTQGLPCFFETRNTPGASQWEVMKRHMLHSVSWMELMGQSVHVRPVLEAMITRYTRKLG